MSMSHNSPRTDAILADIAAAVEAFAPFYDFLDSSAYECVETHVCATLRTIRAGKTYNVCGNAPGMLEFRELLAEFYPADHDIWASLFTPAQEAAWEADYNYAAPCAYAPQD